jgi:hypothetical protein
MTSFVTGLRRTEYSIRISTKYEDIKLKKEERLGVMLQIISAGTGQVIGPSFRAVTQFID